MKWGIIGFGSIGKRHATNISSMNDEVVVVSSSKDCEFKKAHSIEELIEVHKPEIIIISNATASHKKSYEEIRSVTSTTPLLIEKPVFDHRYDFKNDPNAFIAYCLRFHPLIMNLKKKIQKQKAISARFYVGQYLPDWRTDRDYRTTYSAKKELGGGVLRDLSHELDLAYYLLGDLFLDFSKVDKVSDLEITSEDLFVGFFKSKKCSNITIEMNYLDRISQRYLTVFTNEETIKVDFITGEIITNKTVEKVAYQKNEMYLTMLKHMKKKEYGIFSNFEDGLKILDIISQAEKK